MKLQQMERTAAVEWERRENEFTLRLSQLEDAQRDALEAAEKKAKYERNQAQHELERLLSEATADRELAAEQLREQKALAAKELERIAAEAQALRKKAEKDAIAQKADAAARQTELTRVATEHQHRTELELKQWMEETRRKKEEADRIEAEKAKQTAAEHARAADEARSQLLTTSASLSDAASAARSHFQAQSSLGKEEVLREMKAEAEKELRKQMEEERKKQQGKEAQQKRIARTLAQQQKAAALAQLELERQRIREEELQRLIGFAQLTSDQKILLKARMETISKQQREIEQAGRGGSPIKSPLVQVQAYPQYPGSPVRGQHASVSGTPIGSPYSHPASPYSSTASPLHPQPPANVSRLHRWPLGGLSAVVAAQNGWTPTSPMDASYGDVWMTSLPSTPSTKPRSYFDAFLETRRSAPQHQYQHVNGGAPRGSPSSHASQPQYSYPHSSPTSYRPLSATSASAAARRTGFLQTSRVGEGGALDEELEVSFLMDSPGQQPLDASMRIEPRVQHFGYGVESERPSSAKQLHHSPPASSRPSVRGGRVARQQAKWTTDA